MKIFINARFLTQPITGVQRFAIEISRQLKKSGQAVHFIAPQDILQKDIARELEVQTFGKLKGHLWEQLELPLFLRREQNPLLINFANTAPLLYRKQIVTIHDLAFRVNPGWFSKAFTCYYNFLIPKIAKNARKVLTVSNSIKHELISELHLPEDKIDVIYNASSITSARIAVEVEEYNKTLPKRYVLAVSSIDERKNFLRLIKAFGLIENKDVVILIIGRKNKIFAEQSFQQVTPQSSRIKFLGFVPDEKLRLLYENAEAFIYPSLYEGFGIPNLEAMQMSCPVITSNINSIREVCSDAVVYVDPYNVEDIAYQIDRLLADKELQEDLKKKGLARSKHFSWVESSKKLIKIIEETVDAVKSSSIS